MKHKETKLVPAKEVEVVVKTTCDLCGCDMATATYYSAEQTEVRHKSGHAYPESGWGEEVTFDICGKCFETKLRPWFESQGAVPTVEEWEY